MRSAATLRTHLFNGLIPYLIIAVLGCALAVVLVEMDIFEWIYEFTRTHESWELDEIIVIGLAVLFMVVAMLLVKMRREIRRRIREENRTREMACHDLLTGLPNRRSFEEELDKRISESHKRNSPVAVVLLDIGGLKPVNDQHGYEVGDRALLSLSNRIRRAMKLQDLVARLDGDEFAMILSVDTSCGDVMRMCERIMASIRQPTFVNDTEVDLIASMGIAIYPDDTKDHRQLLQYAAMARRQAKGNKPNRIAFFDSGLNDAQRAYADLRTDIGRALRNDEFVPYFQPLVSLQDDKLKSFEVLARWDHPKQGMLSAGVFISAAEEMSLISNIFWMILRQACEAARSWSQPMSIAVNLSPVQFADSRLGEKILSVLRETGLAPGRLVVEITESVLISDITAARKVITFLREHDIRFSLDDFGTGYSSLQYLHQLPFDSVKIDRSFITSFGQSHENTMIVSSTLALCRSLGMKTTAEGVENETILDQLKSLGCTFAQGYLYSRPVGAADAARMVELWSDRPCRSAMSCDIDPAEADRPAVCA